MAGHKIELDYNGMKVEITRPHGDVGSWHIMVNNYFQGHVVKNDGAWTPYLNKGTVLTGDDVSVILEMIEKAAREEGG